MAYKLKYRNLNQEQIERVLEMNIPNSDDKTNEELWVSNAKERIDLDWKMADEVIDVFLGKDK